MNIKIIVQIVLFRGDSLLVAPQGSLWGLPSGELENGETIEDGAARILFRDTGVIGHQFSVYTSRCISTEGEDQLIAFVQGEYLFSGEQESLWEWHPWTAIPSPKSARLEELLRLYWNEHTQTPYEPEIEAELFFGASSKRGSQRVELSAFVTAENSTIRLASKSNNVSRGGLFLVTDADLLPGQEMVLNITLPNQRVIQCNGRVKWKRPSYLATKHKPAGVGIEFISPPKPVVEALNETLLRYQSLSFQEKFPSSTGEYGALQRAAHTNKR